MVKPTGRKKVDIVRMRNQRNLQVTFSKRRDGLFKKATELSILCGVESASVVFSPDNKSVYSIGHPSVNYVVDKFLAGNRLPNTDGPNPLPEPQQNSNISAAVCRELNDIEEMLEAEINHGKEVQARNTEGPYENLNYLQLQELSENIKDKLKMVGEVALKQQECGIPFSYKTYGLAFAPREYHSSSSGAGPSESR